MSIFKEIKYATDNHISATHETIPDEELWEDGELNAAQVQQKIIYHTFQQRDWILVREVDNGED